METVEVSQAAMCPKPWICPLSTGRGTLLILVYLSRLALRSWKMGMICLIYHTAWDRPADWVQNGTFRARQVLGKV